MAVVFFLEEITTEEVNPYEAVKAASIEARRINQVRGTMEVNPDDEKATTLGLRRLAEKKIAVKYDRSEAVNPEGGEGSGKA